MSLVLLFTVLQFLKLAVQLFLAAKQYYVVPIYVFVLFQGCIWICYTLAICHVVTICYTLTLPLFSAHEH